MPNENETPTRIEQYLAKAAGEDADLPSVPMTRIEQYLAKIAGEDVELPEETYTRIEQYLKHIAENGGGGGDITLETLNVSANGTTNAPSGKAYNKVVASVPNSYAAGDEGKVVSGGSLVSQTAHAQVTQNGTIDTTLNNSVEVDVPSYSIGAVFTQGENLIFTTDTLDDLRKYLVVTAYYSDNTSEEITDYTLSGSLTAGVSTITVTALNLTTTFSVTVIAATDVTPDISTWSASGNNTVIGVDEDAGTIFVNSSVSFAGVQSPLFSTEAGYNYRFAVSTEILRGSNHQIGFRNSSNVVFVRKPVTDSGDTYTDDLLSDASNYTTSVRVSYFTGWTTSESAAALIGNIKVIKYLTVDANQVLNALMGGVE